MYSARTYGIMVIYNKCLEDSETYKCLCGQDLHLIVCDNSTDLERYSHKNQQFAIEKGISYLSMEGNKGLSVAYNQGVAYLQEHFDLHEDDWICLFDDDTKVPSDYVATLHQEEYKKSRILLPIVEDSLGIMSPVWMNKGVARRFGNLSELENVPNNRISGINSAMAIRASIFSKYRYNEEMFLDYIDHKFIMDMRREEIYPDVMKLRIWQDFSAVSDTKEAARKRFRLQKKDLKIFYEKQPFQYAYVVIKKHMKLVLKYKDITMFYC